MTRTEDLVPAALFNPQALKSFSLKDWDLLIRQARKVQVLGRIHSLLQDEGLIRYIPTAPRNHLEAAWVMAGSQERVIRWEVYCIQRALASVPTEIVLLKGAAYILSGLPFAQGRLQTDVDILVPKSKLKAVESALLEHGWTDIKLDNYDQRYYREWSHELPPLYHPVRRTVIDVHHNILPETGRLHPDADKLFQAAEPIPGTPYKRLCSADMILHASAHLFQDGDLERGLRQLADIDGLLRVFGTRTGFVQEVSQRAREMDLSRPLFYALRYSQRFLKTPVPQDVISAIGAEGPPGPVLRMMDKLVSKALSTRRTSASNFKRNSARWLLYVRSHWLRMPPSLLVRHLVHQAFRKKDNS